MTPRFKALIRKRAAFRCEYCHFPEAVAELRFQYDHIIAQQHGGRGTEDNLAFACFRCNSSKGPNLSGIDRTTGKMERLFHPRRDEWETHFRWVGRKLVGRTATGRVTISVLDINRPEVLLLREALLAEGIQF